MTTGSVQYPSSPDSGLKLNVTGDVARSFGLWSVWVGGRAEGAVSGQYDFARRHKQR